MFNWIALHSGNIAGVTYRSVLNHFPGDNYTLIKKKRKEKVCLKCGKKAVGFVNVIGEVFKDLRKKHRSKLDFKIGMAIKRELYKW